MDDAPLPPAPSEREYDDQALRDERFRLLVQATAECGIALLDPEGVIVTWNAGAERISGYRANEALGLHYSRFHPDDAGRGGTAGELAAATAAGRHEKEGWHARKDGSRFWANVVVGPLLDGAGALRGFSQVTRDAGRQKQRDEGLDQAGRDLVRFFELSPDLFCIASLGGFFLRVNANFSRLLGHPDEEFLSRPFLDFVHPDDRAATLAEMARLSAGLTVVHFRNRYRDSRGGYRWLEWTARAVPAEEVIFAAARDVSERVRMERELLAREERERAILDNTMAVIYVKGIDGRYVFVNQRHADLFSLDRDAVIGKTEHEIFSKEVADEFERNDRRVLETAETITIQETAPHPDGIHTYVSVKFPLLDATGEVSAVAGISTDITDQLRARAADEQMRLAQAFQQRLYPAAAPPAAGLDVAGSALPVAHLCGDYFDYFDRGGGRLAVSLGDVSGHGFGPALQMVQVRAVIRVLLRGAAPLHEVAAELNRMLCVDLPESSFVSLLLAEFDAGRRELRHVGAGHRALLFRAGGGVETLGSTGPLLGIDDAASYDGPPATPVGEGDLLVLFTDGLTEAMSPAGEQFGQGRLEEAVRSHLREPSQAVLDRLFAAVYDFAGGQPIQDDMTAVAVKVLG